MKAPGFRPSLLDSDIFLFLDFGDSEKILLWSCVKNTILGGALNTPSPKSSVFLGKKIRSGTHFHSQTVVLPASRNNRISYRKYCNTLAATDPWPNAKQTSHIHAIIFQRPTSWVKVI
jgi:hypothetical protein